MGPDTWTAVEDHVAGLLVAPDDALTAAVDASAAAGLPSHQVSPLQGKLLHLLARACRARRILEIGTLGGYSTIWLARALPPGGDLVTLEVSADHGAVARTNIERAGLADVVEVRVGPALETLPRLAADGRGPFDFIFIDADKPNTPAYLDWAVALSRPGAVIAADNVVRAGAVADAGSDDPSAVGVRRLLEVLAEDPRVDATAIQTVGTKGYDGFALAVVQDVSKTVSTSPATTRA